MSVVAWDGKLIAADSLAVFNDERAARPAEKIRIRDRGIFALCGNAAIFDAVINWYLAGAEPLKVPDGKKVDWEFLVIRKPSIAEFYCSDVPYPSLIKPPFTIGSGGALALGAMGAGANAVRAVEVACDLHTQCGLPVVSYDVQKEIKAAVLIKTTAKPRF